MGRPKPMKKQTNKENKYVRNKILVFILWSLCDILKTSGIF